MASYMTSPGRSKPYFIYKDISCTLFEKVICLCVTVTIHKKLIWLLKKMNQTNCDMKPIKCTLLYRVSFVSLVVLKCIILMNWFICPKKKWIDLNVILSIITSYLVACRHVPWGTWMFYLVFYGFINMHHHNCLYIFTVLFILIY